MNSVLSGFNLGCIVSIQKAMVATVSINIKIDWKLLILAICTERSSYWVVVCETIENDANRYHIFYRSTIGYKKVYPTHTSLRDWVIECSGARISIVNSKLSYLKVSSNCWYHCSAISIISYLFWRIVRSRLWSPWYQRPQTYLVLLQL